MREGFTPASGQAATNQITNLPCASTTPSGTGYDSGGNQLCSTDQYGGISQYTYDGENRISQISALNSSASPFVSYTYGGDGTRTRKTLDSTHFTDYVEFNGAPIAERDQDGNWTDYIYANGKKIAMTPATEAIFQIGGSSSGSFTSSYTTPTPALTGYVFRMGDKLLVRQMQTGAATGGIRLTAGSQTSDGYDLDGQWSTDDHIMGQWHSRVIPLDALAGNTFSQFVFGCGTGSQGIVGAYTVQYASIGVLSLDGTLRTIFDSDPSASFSFLNEDTQSAHGVQAIPATAAATHFFLGDHLGTAQMEFSAAGFPLWQGQFAPYGQEIQNGSLLPPDQPDGTANHYKFTGKERDAESGLDYFGARYYASSMGRFMSPDWSAKQEPVPYSKLDNPQSLNLYAYEFNNPLGGVDADGHGCGGPGEAPCPTAQQQIGQDPTLPTGVAPSVRERVYDGVTETAATVGNAIAPKTTADLVSLALMVPTDGLGGLLPEAGAALSRVMELSGAMGKTADYVTLAVTETQEGTKVVSSSENALRPAVKALLKDGEVAAKGAGHAEVTGVNAAKQMGLTPTGVAASRGICPSCATYLKAAGVAALSALRQYF